MQFNGFEDSVVELGSPSEYVIRLDGFDGDSVTGFDGYGDFTVGLFSCDESAIHFDGSGDSRVELR